MLGDGSKQCRPASKWNSAWRSRCRNSVLISIIEHILMKRPLRIHQPFLQFLQFTRLTAPWSLWRTPPRPDWLQMKRIGSVGKLKRRRKLLGTYGSLWREGQLTVKNLAAQRVNVLNLFIALFSLYNWEAKTAKSLCHVLLSLAFSGRVEGHWPPWRRWLRDESQRPASMGLGGYRLQQWGGLGCWTWHDMN